MTGSGAANLTDVSQHFQLPLQWVWMPMVWLYHSHIQLLAFNICLFIWLWREVFNVRDFLIPSAHGVTCSPIFPGLKMAGSCLVGAERQSRKSIPTTVLPWQAAAPNGHMPGPIALSHCPSSPINALCLPFPRGIPWGQSLSLGLSFRSLYDKVNEFAPAVNVGTCITHRYSLNQLVIWSRFEGKSTSNQTRRHALWKYKPLQTGWADKDLGKVGFPPWPLMLEKHW